tara:strand:+ start:5759 stop:6271 length:513 start_codon:yes stop_codon:yes gene_type:complete
MTILNHNIVAKYIDEHIDNIYINSSKYIMEKVYFELFGNYKNFRNWYMNQDFCVLVFKSYGNERWCEYKPTYKKNDEKYITQQCYSIRYYYYDNYNLYNLFLSEIEEYSKDILEKFNFDYLNYHSIFILETLLCWNIISKFIKITKKIYTREYLKKKIHLDVFDKLYLLC